MIRSMPSSLKPVHQVSSGGAGMFGARSGALWNGWSADVGGRYRGPTRQPMMLTPAISVIAIIADVHRCSVVLSGGVAAANFDCCISLLTSMVIASGSRFRRRSNAIPNGIESRQKPEGHHGTDCSSANQGVGH